MHEAARGVSKASVVTLPMRAPPLWPGAAHDVSAPGGYEWWRIVAHDPEHDRQFEAVYHLGCVLDPAYLRATARYLSGPTNNPPPAPQDYAAVSLVVLEKGRVRAELFSRCRAENASIVRQRSSVIIGSSRLEISDDGSVLLDLRGAPVTTGWRGRRTVAQQTLSAQLRLRPHSASSRAERHLGCRHRWALTDGYEVEGAIHLFGHGRPDGPLDLPFRGNGLLEQQHGTRLLALGLRRWLHVCVVAGGDACAVQGFTKRDEHLMTLHTSGVAGDSYALQWSRPALDGVRHPVAMAFGDDLVLRGPRVVQRSPGHARILYDAQLRQRRGVALCSISSPRWLRWWR